MIPFTLCLPLLRRKTWKFWQVEQAKKKDRIYLGLINKKFPVCGIIASFGVFFLLIHNYWGKNVWKKIWITTILEESTWQTEDFLHKTGYIGKWSGAILSVQWRDYLLVHTWGTLTNMVQIEQFLWAISSSGLTVRHFACYWILFESLSCFFLWCSQSKCRAVNFLHLCSNF